jgi:hypothetical protein
MQPRTPPRQITRSVNDNGHSAVPVHHCDRTKQIDGQLSLSAADTRAHRADEFAGVVVGRWFRRLALVHR